MMTFQVFTPNSNRVRSIYALVDVFKSPVSGVYPFRAYSVDTADVVCLWCHPEDVDDKEIRECIIENYKLARKLNVACVCLGVAGSIILSYLHPKEGVFTYIPFVESNRSLLSCDGLYVKIGESQFIQGYHMMNLFNHPQISWVRHCSPSGIMYESPIGNNYAEAIVTLTDINTIFVSMDIAHDPYMIKGDLRFIQGHVYYATSQLFKQIKLTNNDDEDNSESNKLFKVTKAY